LIEIIFNENQYAEPVINNKKEDKENDSQESGHESGEEEEVEDK
jgi:hypothetical protein